MSESQPDPTQKITIKKNGPYKVEGKVPFIKLTQVCSEYGEPLEWEFLGDQTPESDSYLLCRCGKSAMTRTSFAAAASLPLTHSAMAAIKRASTDLKLPAPTVLPCAFSPIADRALQ